MKTILWKELRENARWVPLGAVAMIAILVYHWRGHGLIFDQQRGLSYLVGLVASSIAVALGLLQCWPDQRPAACALLLHRGITANAAFWGKLVASLLLYVAAVYLPLLGMAIFIVVGGLEHRAASPGALLPSAFISVVAYCFWPVGFLVLQRDARFIGSRMLPAVPAALLLFCCSIADEYFWVAISLAAMGLVAFVLMARSVFINSTHVATRIGRAALAVVITIALLSGVIFVGSTIESHRRHQAYARGESPHRQYLVQLGPDGRAWLTRSDYSWSNGGYQVDQAVKLTVGGSVRDQLQPVAEDWERPQGWRLHTSLRYNHLHGLGQRFLHFATAAISGSAGDFQRYWIFDSKADVILVYRYSIYGYSMFRPWQLEARLLPPGPTGSFGEVRQWVDAWGRSDKAGDATLVCSTGVYRIPGNGSDVETVYRVPTSSRIVGVSMPGWNPEAPQPLGMMLKLHDRVVLLESKLDAEAVPQAKPLGAFSGIDESFATEILLPNELATAATISIARHPNDPRSYLGLVHGGTVNNRSIAWMQFDDRGQIERQEHYEEDLTSATAYEQKLVAALIPPGLWAVGVATAAVASEDYSWVENARQHTRAKPFDVAMMAFLLALQPMLGIPLAMWAVRRRKLDKRQTRTWIWWAFLMGPAGSLAILAVYPRIALEPCTHCQHPTRLALTSCEHCDHSLDEIPKTGIEIFDYDEPAPTITTEPAGI